MIGKTARERAATLGLDLGVFRTERELRVAIRREEKERGLRIRAHDCDLNAGDSWCPIHGAFLK